jgi:hypothetical protein
MGWIDSIIERADQAQAAYEAKRVEHNRDIDEEIRELDYIVTNELRPGMPLATAQAAILRAQARLLKKQWEAMRME